jgi:putative transposase
MFKNNGCPKMINIDQSGANKEAIRTYNIIEVSKE